MWKRAAFWKWEDGRPKGVTVFLILALLSLLQIPSSHLAQKGMFSASILINEWGVLLGGVWLWTKILKLPWKKVTVFRQVRAKQIGWLLLLAISLFILIDYLIFLGEQVWAPDPQIKTFLDLLMTANTTAEILWKWFLLCITPAICEEILFRGFFQPSLVRQYGVFFGMAITALFFALLHGIPAYFHLYFLLGFLFCWLYQVTKNLWFPILAHLLNNSWTFGMHLFSKEIPQNGIMQPFDFFVMLICIGLAAAATRRFAAAARVD